MSKRRIAIIGAGISGLHLARCLQPHATVQVFEKARGAGGRMSTRYAAPYFFDHGAQYFTARSEAFRAFLAPYLATGTVALWEGKVITLQPGKAPHDRIWFEPHYVASPHMNSLCKAMAEGISLQLGCEVAPLAVRDAAGWQLFAADGAPLGAFDWVISTAPPVQTARLFAQAPGQAFATAARLQACYALMLGLDAPWQKPWMAAKLLDSTLAWIAVNSSKPGRDTQATSLVVHAATEWSEQHADAEMGWAQEVLLAALKAEAGIDAAGAAHIATHRWRYAFADVNEPEAPYLNEAAQLAACGDWCEGGRVEAAWLAADRLAQQLRALVG